MANSRRVKSIDALVKSERDVRYAARLDASFAHLGTLVQLDTRSPRFSALKVFLMSTSQSPPSRRKAAPRLSSLEDRIMASDLACRLCLEGQAEDEATFHLGLGTFRVPMAMHEAIRLRFVKRMPVGSQGVVLLQGGDQQTRYDTDHEPVFRQESYFNYLFGVSEAGCYGAITLPDGRATLFVPHLGEDYEVFCGRYPSTECFRERYGVEDVRHIDDLNAWLEEQLDDSEKKLYLLAGLNTDSGNYALPAKFPGHEEFANRSDLSTLFGVIAEARVTKISAEIELMRYVNWVSSMAHVEVMRAARPGMMEYQLEALFQHHTYTHGGCRHMSYACICACGPNPAILHYGHAGRPNSREIKNGDIALLDMGAEYHCYASDITCSFPIVDSSQKPTRFTPDQALVYEAVLAAQRAVLAALKPGVMWQDMHRIAERAILKALLEGGVLTMPGYTDTDKAISAMLDVDLGAVFMPHGLGHLIGLDTHDVGGYLPGTTPRSKKPGLSKLRTARRIEEGMVLTVEPGCYFIDLLIDRALADPKQAIFLVPERLAMFRGTGGVRLEDDVVITPTGVDNLTLCPRTLHEIDNVLNGGPWPPLEDEAPELKRRWCRPNPAIVGGIMEKFTLKERAHA